MIDQPSIPVGEERCLPPGKLPMLTGRMMLTGRIIRGAPLTVLAVGAALAHTQAFSPRECGAGVVRARSTLAGVKLGCVFLESSLEVVPSCHRTGDISY